MTPVDVAGAGAVGGVPRLGCDSTSVMVTELTRYCRNPSIPCHVAAVYGPPTGVPYVSLSRKVTVSLSAPPRTLIPPGK